MPKTFNARDMLLGALTDSLNALSRNQKSTVVYKKLKSEIEEIDFDKLIGDPDAVLAYNIINSKLQQIAKIDETEYFRMRWN